MKQLLIVLFLSTVLLQSATFIIQNVDINKTNGYIVYKKGTTQKITGTLNRYYEDNKTIKTITPLIDGQIEGIFKSFYKSSKIKSEIAYHQSKRDGKSIVYHENGKKMYEANIVNDKKEGKVEEWYANGQLKYSVLFTDDKVSGLVKIYEENGTVEMVNEYKDGKIIKQIQPKKPNNIMLQTRALTTYGEGDKIYYLFISPSCGHCKKFLDGIAQYKKEVTFYIYYIPSNPNNRDERKILDIVYSKKGVGEKIKSIFEAKNGTLDLSQKVKDEDLYRNNIEIAKAQQMQMNMNIRAVPAIIDTKGFIYSSKEFISKFKK